MRTGGQISLLTQNADPTAQEEQAAYKPPQPSGQDKSKQYQRSDDYSEPRETVSVFSAQNLSPPPYPMVLEGIAFFPLKTCGIHDMMPT